jgi:GxxExxY protein
MKQMNDMNRNGFSAEQGDPFTEKVIGLAIQVHKELGPGFLESVYHKSLLMELTEAGIGFESEEVLEVFYKGKPAGIFVADIIVETRLLLELKAVEFISKIHEVQIVNYLKATKLELGLILNFGGSTLQVKRRYRERPHSDIDLRLHEI